MTSVACGGCGRTLVATPGHAGLTVKCAECGALVNIPAHAVEVLEDGPENGRLRDAATTLSGAAAVDPARDPRPALSGAVPDPVASGADDRSTTALALAAISLVFPLLAPFALWYVHTTARQLAANSGGVEPTTLRNARVLARVGCSLLVCVILLALLILIVIS